MTDRSSILAALDSVASEVRTAHPDAADRLAQLDSHVATVKMIVDHIYDEAETG